MNESFYFFKHWQERYDAFEWCRNLLTLMIFNRSRHYGSVF